jgi:hypothetical protein
MFPTRFANIVWNPRFVNLFDFHVEVSEIGMHFGQIQIWVFDISLSYIRHKHNKMYSDHLDKIVLTKISRRFYFGPFFIKQTPTLNT